MYNTRIERLLERLGKEGLDGLLVTSLPNIRYLSGFPGSTAQLVLTPEHRWFLTDSRYHERVAREVEPSYELVDNTGKKFVEDMLPVLAGKARLKRIGFETGNVTHAAFQKLEQAGGSEFVPTKSWVEDLRQVKDDDEIERLRASVLLNERIFSEVIEVIDSDVTEAGLAAEIYYRAVKYGAEKVSFDPIVASGVNSSMPHAGFTTEKLVPGAPLTVDMGVLLDGYCSDMTRTVFYKDCPAKWAGIYNTVREAKDKAYAALKPGMQGKEVDAVARDYIGNAGHAEHFGHGLGHGVGLEVHEGPGLAKTCEQKLVVGNVVTIEPGIYLPGDGGMRIEDMVVVTEDGASNLNSLDTGIRVVG